MSSLENQTHFHTTHEINTTVDAQFNGSTEFILITDHQTSKSRSREKTDLKSNDKENCFQACLSSVFRKKILYKRLPILTWLPKYNSKDAIGDLIAGITVGLTVIPQGLAYSSVAGLPTQVGCVFYFFYIAFVSFVFCFE